MDRHTTCRKRHGQMHDRRRVPPHAGSQRRDPPRMRRIPAGKTGGGLSCSSRRRQGVRPPLRAGRGGGKDTASKEAGIKQGEGIKDRERQAVRHVPLCHAGARPVLRSGVGQGLGRPCIGPTGARPGHPAARPATHPARACRSSSPPSACAWASPGRRRSRRAPESDPAPGGHRGRGRPPFLRPPPGPPPAPHRPPPPRHRPPCPRPVLLPGPPPAQPRPARPPPPPPRPLACPPPPRPARLPCWP